MYVSSSDFEWILSEVEVARQIVSRTFGLLKFTPNQKN